MADELGMNVRAVPIARILIDAGAIDARIFEDSAARDPAMRGGIDRRGRPVGSFAGFHCGADGGA